VTLPFTYSPTDLGSLTAGTTQSRTKHHSPPCVSRTGFLTMPLDVRTRAVHAGGNPDGLLRGMGFASTAGAANAITFIPGRCRLSENRPQARTDRRIRRARNPAAVYLLLLGAFPA
jgi:hypothetical protein